MENEDVIREQMEDTRTSLSEKLETLESKVASTVEGATTNVADTVEAVKDTVEAVKDTVQETVTTVKESVDQTINAVKETVQQSVTAVKGLFDVPGHVRTHPWLMFGASVAAGYLLEPYVGRIRGRGRGSRTAFSPDHVVEETRFSQPHYAQPQRGQTQHGQTGFMPSTLEGILKKFEPELRRLKGLAVGTAMTALRDAVIKAVPQNMVSTVNENLDGITQKLGGERLEPQSGNSERQSNGKHHEAHVGAT